MLEQIPGYLGYGNIIVIHADWPIYTSGMVWETALRMMGNFPKDTMIYEIDDIDRCKLLINKPPTQLKDIYHKSLYQIAIWHVDLIELKQKGYVNGVSEKSENEFGLIRFEAYKNELGKYLELDKEGNIVLYSRDTNGNLISHKYYKPILDSDEENELDFRPCAYIKELDDMVSPLVQINRFDTAVREASLLLETKIRAFHQADSFGQELIDYHIDETIKCNGNLFSAALKCYRGE